MFGGTFSPDFSEQEIVSRIVHSRELYSVFESFIVPFYLHPRESFSEAWIYTEVASEHIGITHGRPGEIDLLYIPMQDGRPQAHNTVCAEVKIIRPTKSNPGKDHKDSGREQVLGLVAHRMPVISLNHIILPETNRYLHGTAYSLDVGPGGMDEVAKHLSGVSHHRQEGRLRGMAIPDFVGYGAAQVEQVGAVLISSLNHGRFCKRNQDYDDSLERYLNLFVEQNPSPELVLPGREGNASLWDD